MSRVGVNSSNQGARMDALQPLRSTKDSVNQSTSYTSKTRERPTPSTPDFDRKKSPIAGTSPLGKAGTRAVGKPLVQSSQKPAIKLVNKTQEKENLLEKRISQLKLAHESSLAQIEVLESASKKDDSFELQERKIRRETLLKDLLLTVARKLSQRSRDNLVDTLDSLKKNSQVYTIRLSCAEEFREVALKTKFLTTFKLASEKYQFRVRLIRNFVRVFERLTKPSLVNVISHAFASVQTAKRALHKTNMKQTKRGKSPPGKSLPQPTETRSSGPGISSQRGENKKSVAAINTSNASTTVTNTSMASAGNPSRVKVKKDTSRFATPGRPPGRQTKESDKAAMQTSTEKKTPAKSITATQLLPPVAAVASPEKVEEAPQPVPPGPRTSAILIPCTSSISSRHQEMKKQLLRQIQGGDLEDDDKPVVLADSKAEWTPETNTSSLLHNASRISAPGVLRGFCPEGEASPPEKPNIFFHSLTDRPEEEGFQEDQLENKLSILLARKQFRRKA